VRWGGSVLVPLLHYATEDVVVGGVTVRKGEAVRAILVSANRDPRVYADPDRLDVTRRRTGRGGGHLGFGHGRHS
jgi:cytochrome P450